MKKCPYCGAEIEEEARFCLYCMRTLTARQKVPPLKKKNIKKIVSLIASVIAAVVLLTTGTVVLARLPKDTDEIIVSGAAQTGKKPDMSQGTAEAEIPQSGVETEAAQQAPETVPSQNSGEISQNNDPGRVQDSGSGVSQSSDAGTPKNESPASAQSGGSGTTKSGSSGSSSQSSNSGTTKSEKSGSSQSGSSGGSSGSSQSGNSGTSQSGDTGSSQESSSGGTQSGNAGTTEKTYPSNLTNASVISDGVAMFDGIRYAYRDATDTDDPVYHSPENCVAITEILTADDEYVLPEMIGGKKVIALDGSMFTTMSARSIARKIWLPRTLRHIKGNGFNNCFGITDIYFCTEPDKIWFQINIFAAPSNRQKNITLHYTSGCKAYGGVSWESIAEAIDGKAVLWDGKI